ncbi:hypothetical protein BC6307_19350 [Sutcliffiella cohnii]|uniref:Uncharacterized protein n=1 Tax=Sutcliffiella cohnii TaxID=33932 RepID=A0A223KUU3_9BACI|nr:hypothetical protein [Sutcliffiella cohnii]AST93259.1 hypothetical protein BC6307_19350 [Sutcliffiella cohnii]
MLTNVYDFVKQTLTKMDAVEAHKYQDAGKGRVVELTQMDALENRVDSAVAKYRKRCEEIKTSDHPQYKVEGAQEFFTKEAQAELEKEVADIQAQYETFANGMRDAAMNDIANRVRLINDIDRKMASDIISNAVTSIKFGGGTSEIDSLIELVPHMNEGRKLALLQEVGKLTEAVKGRHDEKALTNQIRGLYRALNDVRSGEYFAMNVAKALPTGVDGAYRRLRITHPSYKFYPNNMYNKGSI